MRADHVTFPALPIKRRERIFGTINNLDFASELDRCDRVPALSARINGADGHPKRFLRSVGKFGEHQAVPDGVAQENVFGFVSFFVGTCGQSSTGGVTLNSQNDLQARSLEL